MQLLLFFAFSCQGGFSAFSFSLSLTYSLLIHHSPNECLNFEFSLYSLNFLVFFCNASTRFNFYYYYYRTCIHTHIECLELPLIHASAAATNSFDLNNLSSEAVVNLNAIYIRLYFSFVLFLA